MYQDITWRMEHFSWDLLIINLCDHKIQRWDPTLLEKFPEEEKSPKHVFLKKILFHDGGVCGKEGGEWGRGADRTRAEAASATLVEAVGLAGETRMASCCCCYKANLEQVRVVACSEKAWERWARRRGEGEEVGNPRLSMLGPIGWRRPSARVKQVNGRSLKRGWADMLLYLDERICVFSGNCWSDNNGVGWEEELWALREDRLLWLLVETSVSWHSWDWQEP